MLHLQKEITAVTADKVFLELHCVNMYAICAGCVSVAYVCTVFFLYSLPFVTSVARVVVVVVVVRTLTFSPTFLSQHSAHSFSRLNFVYICTYDVICVCVCNGVI